MRSVYRSPNAGFFLVRFVYLNVVAELLAANHYRDHPLFIWGLLITFTNVAFRATSEEAISCIPTEVHLLIYRRIGRGVTTP